MEDKANPSTLVFLIKRQRESNLVISSYRKILIQTKCEADSLIRGIEIDCGWGINDAVGKHNVGCCSDIIRALIHNLPFMARP